VGRTRWGQRGASTPTKIRLLTGNSKNSSPEPILTRIIEILAQKPF
jgi:hypothetical protein